MHFRCVITMLKCYVLVGLDWAKPMMFLILHVTCSCSFHAYVPSFFSILMLICVGAFLRVSLSPSLFLSISYSMAPKRKSTMSQNLLCFGASSSSSLANSTPSHVRFHDDKARKDFWRTFHNEAFI